MGNINCVLWWGMCGAMGPLPSCCATLWHNGDNEVKDNEDHQHLQSAVPAHFFIIWFTHSRHKGEYDQTNTINGHLSMS